MLKELGVYGKDLLHQMERTMGKLAPIYFSPDLCLGIDLEQADFHDKQGRDTPHFLGLNCSEPRSTDPHLLIWSMLYQWSQGIAMV
jgi:hypothetical protein